MRLSIVISLQITGLLGCQIVSEGPNDEFSCAVTADCPASQVCCADLHCASNCGTGGTGSCASADQVCQTSADCCLGFACSGGHCSFAPANTAGGSSGGPGSSGNSSSAASSGSTSAAGSGSGTTSNGSGPSSSGGTTSPSSGSGSAGSSGGVTGSAGTGGGSTSATTTGGSTAGSASGGSTTGSSGPPIAVVTLAGNGVAGYVDGSGGRTGPAEFDVPKAVAADAYGNVYVADSANHCIRQISAGGNVTTLAGSGQPGYADGSPGPNGTARFDTPFGVGVDAHGDVFVADTFNQRIRRIDPSGNVTTVAGNGQAASVDGTGGPSGTASFDYPFDVAADGAGNLYVTDALSNRIRKIDSSGNVTTLAGNGTAGYADGTGGPTGTAEFSYPYGIAVDALGNVFVGDTNNDRIREIDPLGNVTTLAGNGTKGSVDGSGGPGGTAEFHDPLGVAVDAAENVYVADGDGERLRLIDASGDVTTLAGNGTPGFVDGVGGPSDTAELDFPDGIAVDQSGNVYVGDSNSSSVRVLGPRAAGWQGVCNPDDCSGGCCENGACVACSCVPPAGACQGSQLCCGGLLCQGGGGPGSLCCVPTHSSCDSSSDCCGSACQGGQCLEGRGEVCNTSGDCVAGTSCTGGFCQ
ncbi:MAG TPA: NHL repeat-containing protein [Myxococcales bacterium]|nr:NHL repeat-containing protein [Myxococcales bacterium]